MSYQNVVGTISANSHPGSYTGQDAYNDMLIVEEMTNEDVLGWRSGLLYTDLKKRRGGQRMPDKDNFNCVIEEIEELEAVGVDLYNQTVTNDVAMAIRSVRTDNEHLPCVIQKPRYIVRRLTPLECERLQGFPDGWTDIAEFVDEKGKVRKTTDSHRYKALGNSIALPSWKWIIKRISAQYERDATMASLFDGIGGFPYCWEQINGKGSCLWASEIEEFPIAVTKERFNEHWDD